MELPDAQQIIDTLYSEIRPYEISHQDRARIATTDESFRYGEIDAEPFGRMLSEVPNLNNRIFYDLGSGTGRIVLLAALLFDFSKAVGIEHLDGLHRTAQEMLRRFNCEVKPALPIEKQKQTIEFRRGDIRDADFSDGDIFYIHCTCFQPELMTKLSMRLEELKPGTLLLMTTKTLSSTKYEIRKSDIAQMDWGRTPVFLLEKIE